MIEDHELIIVRSQEHRRSFPLVSDGSQLLGLSGGPALIKTEADYIEGGETVNDNLLKRNK